MHMSVFICSTWSAEERQYSELKYVLIKALSINLTGCRNILHRHEEGQPCRSVDREFEDGGST
jgi:hypothetical protein